MFPLQVGHPDAEETKNTRPAFAPLTPRVCLGATGAAWPRGEEDAELELSEG